MLRKGFSWVNARRKRSAAVVVCAALLGVNALAWVHARAMTRFEAGGDKTRNPEALGTFEKAKVLFTGVTLPRPDNWTTPESLGLHYEVHRFPTSDGLELEGWHVTHPQARGLVLLFHGYSVGKSSLLREAQAFHGLGWASFLVDFRGSGGSGGNETTIGVREADDVRAALDYARERWPGRPYVLFGQSMGSAAVLRAVAAHKIKPAAVVLECPFDKLIATVGARFTAMGLPAFPGAQLLVFWGGVQHGFNGFNHNPVEYAKQVRCPVLMLHGERDVRVTCEQATAIYENLAGEKEFELIAGAAHESYVAVNPRQWKDAVGRFLERHAEP